MRRLGALLPLLPVLLLGPTLVGCGEESAGPSRAADSTASEPTVLRHRLVTATESGDGPDTHAVALEGTRALDAFVAGFSDGLAREVRSAATDLEVRDGEQLAGQVVAVGCDEPSGVEALAAEGGVVLEPGPVPSPGRQCLAAMTTVALVVLEEGVSLNAS
ncbi:hypothetical protein I601_0409 [Nocardioides dokdonensis FR1436]|uniref:Lipoprotein n=1 Tax=Nocardioides dokdonensis FR1436 TaxID=1300347 RepID=A0A1A9GH53_9ACTN|nr:hypothetical protein [Nocardioides dokdonensis]ANH36861.1 hypothetical protein I601_0409 [Nocardioides dokdonensis FR1436]